MRTMACVWFTVILLIGVQKVLSRTCEENSRDIKTCDECFRCGGKWCLEPGNVGCNLSPEDSWCPKHQESVFRINDVDNPGDLIDPIYAERSLLVQGTSIINVQYTTKGSLRENDVKVNIINSTQNYGLTIAEDGSKRKCSDKNCRSSINAYLSSEFCSDSGTTEEFVYVGVSVKDLGQSAVIKYHVACACECSKIVEPKSEHCSGHGNYSCGVCKCEEGWEGEKCNEEHCTERGDDVPSCMNSFNGLDCSGNGYCDHCHKCHCNMSLEGSQYFEPFLCSDLCMTINDCPDCVDCLYNSTMTECEGVPLPGYINNMNVLNRNVTSLDERDGLNRKMWVGCSVEVKDCQISYMAKKDEANEIYVTVIESCNNVIAGAYTPAPTVSIVLGVLAAVAAVVAVAGVMIYKHMNALPPAPLNGAGYTDIDAEDCVGENPLYKPPTSSFNNPAYGKKW